MKISILRDDIILRLVDIKGDRARIGNAPECEIFVDDTYLSPHVGDLVLKDGTWRIVDAGGLNGIRSKNGPVDDEPIVDGARYSVGGYDIIPHLDGAKPSRAAPPTESFPETIVGSRKDFNLASNRPASDRADEVQGRSPAPRSAGEYARGFQSVVTNEAPAAQPPRSRRLLVVLCVAVAGILVLLVVVLMRDEPKAVPAATTSTEAAAPSHKSPDADDETLAGERALAALDYEKGLKHWESALALKREPKLQRRYALVAIDVGHALIAQGQPSHGLEYLRKAVTLGPSGDESVIAVKRELEERLPTP
jgi:predicted component of type VI protein secretion system